MSKFVSITSEVVVADVKFADYLRRANIVAAKKGGAFVGNYEVAPDEFRKYGIVLPKGGMIIPDAEPDTLKGVVAKAEEFRLKREEAERRNALAEALRKFSTRNDLVVLRSLMASPAYRDADLMLYQSMEPEKLARYENGLRECSSAIWCSVDAINTSYLAWLLEQNATPYLFASATSVTEVVVATAFSKRLGRFFNVTPEGIEALNREWQAIEDTDSATFRQIVDANPDRAVVTRGGVTPTISLFGVEYRFSTLKVADRYLSELRRQFMTFGSEAEADLASRILTGEQPRYEEREEDWTEGPKMRPEGKGRYIGGVEKVTVTFIGPHRVYSTGDHFGMHHAYQRLLEMRGNGVNIKPRLSASDD